MRQTETEREPKKKKRTDMRRKGKTQTERITVGKERRERGGEGRSPKMDLLLRVLAKIMTKIHAIFGDSLKTSPFVTADISCPVGVLREKIN